MAPEVIEHNPYREKADVFSFGILMWELLTGRVPYEQMTPLQAAVGVVQKGLRPVIPGTCPEGLAAVMRECWQRDPRERPPFESLKVRVHCAWDFHQCLHPVQVHLHGWENLCLSRDDKVRLMVMGRWN